MNSVYRRYVGGEPLQSFSDADFRTLTSAHHRQRYINGFKIPKGKEYVLTPADLGARHRLGHDVWTYADLAIARAYYLNIGDRERFDRQNFPKLIWAPTREDREWRQYNGHTTTDSEADSWAGSDAEP